MNEVVKYDNYMNNLRFKHFTSVDYNFLMALCNKLRDQDVSEIKISFEDLRDKTGYTRTSISQFVSDLKRMNKKLMEITCNLETDGKIVMFVLFPTFVIDLDKQELTVSVNENFRFILNELVKNFTRFDLQEFVSLDSKYSKSLYRLLKQYRMTGIYEVPVDDFREKMDCPESYSNKQFMQNVINPAVRCLSDYFQDLKCTCKYARKRGKPVSGYIFTFTPETAGQDGPGGYGRQEKKAQKAKSNDFHNFNQRTYNFAELEKELLSIARPGRSDDTGDEIE